VTGHRQNLPPVGILIKKSFEILSKFKASRLCFQYWRISATVEIVCNCTFFNSCHWQSKFSISMGKHRKPSKAPGAKVSATANDQDVPSFDENALSALTEKIEQGFAKGNGPQKPDVSAAKSKKQEKANNSSKQDSSKRKSKPQESRRGTKRDAEGNAKEKTNGSSNKSQYPSTEREILLQEILALGGTEEDLDLVLDAQSDSENEDAGKPAAVDKKFQSEFSKFVASLGIDSKASEAEVDDDEVKEDEAEEEEEGDDWEEASESEASVAEKVPAVPEKSPVNTKESLKDQNRLVSTPNPQF
jgi:ribosome biogenesis protein MAK21